MTMPVTAAEAEGKADEVPGGRFEAMIYDPLLAWAERAGMAERRAKLLGDASGRVLEIGSGTGLNLPHYPSDVELVLAEPQLHMTRHIESRLEELGREAQVVRATAEALPFEDDSFDTVVSTLVFCTTGDPEQAMEEARRVLRPGGSLLFLEHVRSEDARLSRWQDRLHGPWQAVAGGCNCNLSTLDTLSESGFQVTVRERADWRRMPPIVRPLVSGSATPS